MFLLIAFSIGLPTLSVPPLTGLPDTPFLLVYLYVALLGPALLVTRWADGPGSVRQLLSRALIWRFGVGRWLVVVFAVPVLTIGLGAATGSLRTPDDGWLTEISLYLFSTLIFGALLANLWEETAWGGFVQTRLMATHGLLVGSVITAPFFAALHIPLYLAGDPTGPELARNLVILFAMAPVYRYLIGMHLLDARGSILAIGIQHAAWNASGKLDSVEGEWQALVAVVLLTLAMATARRRTGDHPRSASRHPATSPRRRVA
jgi:membrane protease YdiL (CAAX protease family)